MQIVDALKNIKNKNVLIFCHDDPDGICSAIILTKLVKEVGGKPFFLTSQYFEYEPEKVINFKKNIYIDVLIVVDKGTIKEYDKYLDIVNEVIVIDHHIPIGIPEKVILFNPSIPNHQISAASGLCYYLKKQVTSVDDLDKFEALIGLKSDWAINPVVKFKGGEISKEIYDELESEFSFLFEVKKNTPTMFEVETREYTTLMNQIAELYFAVSGGGFQYFYNDRGIDVYQPEFLYTERLNAMNYNLKKIRTLEEFISLHKNADLIRKIYKFYLEDWADTYKKFKNSSIMFDCDDFVVYFFEGNFVKLMPMIGSLWAYEFKKVNNKEVVMVMLDDRDGSLHFSFRATKAVINLGVIAHQLAEKLIEYKIKQGFENPQKEISGGGHPIAAECRTRALKFNKLIAVKMLKEIIESNIKC
ncbi:MAG: DHH family phosphoesterase [bacterium]|nr:DHH family phosphoesterase [bacterium]